MSTKNENMAASQPIFREPGGGKDYAWGKDHIFIKLSRAETGGMITLIQDNLKAGFDLAMHHHIYHTEIFYILEGEVAFELKDTTFTAKPGSVVFLPAGTSHAAHSSTDGRMLMFYTPGGFDDMLAEIADAPWYVNFNPFLTSRRNKRHDFMKGLNKTEDQSEGPEHKFLESLNGPKTTFATGESTLKLSSEETHGLTTMTEEIVQAGIKRAPDLPSNQAEILYVLDGEVEFTLDGKTQAAKTGATLYFPAGTKSELKSTSETKLLVFRTPS